ncbi:FdtA/QdtA family cupin domain-containing protein [bacterium]|nr:FdtA/QdtA family cupin domain-containing protein [bacterium]
MKKKTTVNDIKIINFSNFKHNDENLFVYPYNTEQVPFLVKRVFLISNVNKNSLRGNHAHKQTQQLFISLKGKILFKFYDGIKIKIITLKDPQKGIYVPRGIWYETHYKDNKSSLLVLNDKLYFEKDYLRDIKNFKIYKNAKSS